MLQQLLLITGFSASMAMSAAPQIEVSSAPALPLPNLIKNSSFEDDIKSWRTTTKTTPDTGIVNEGAYAGKKCYKIAGDKKSNVNVAQSIVFTPPLPAGAPICSSFAMKSEEQDNALTRPGAAIMTYHPDKTYSYISSPAVPRDSHDWLLVSSTSFAKKPVSSMMYYLCYYKQTGFSLWDDLTVKAGWVKLNVKVTMKDIKAVKVYGQLQHLIFDSGIMKKGINSFEKTFEVYPMGGYCIEVTDASGTVVREFYPKDSKNAVAANGGLSIMPRFNEEEIKQRDALTCKFAGPESSGKKVCLDFNVRACSAKTAHVAGWASGSLKIKLNGKPVNTNRLIGRKVFFNRSNGSVGNVGSDSFIAFHSPWCFSIDTENTYCPVDVKDHNPFKYVLDITDLLKPGENVLEFSNTIRMNPKSKVNLYLSSAGIFTQ